MKRPFFDTSILIAGLIDFGESSHAPIQILNRTSQSKFFKDATSNRIRGGRIYGFHIGMIALAHQTSAIVTENKKHFLSFERQGIDVLSASEFLVALNSEI